MPAELANTSCRLLDAIRAGNVRQHGGRAYIHRRAGRTQNRSLVSEARLAKVADHIQLGQDDVWHLNDAGNAVLDAWLVTRACRQGVAVSRR